MSCARTRTSVGPLRWTWQSTCSTACWSWDARTTSAWPNPGPGWGHCARIPDPCNTALLDAHSVSFVGGTISLHDEGGVPLRNLGIGSMRLLIAGLQRKAAEKATIILVDELEHGLEPHRIVRFVNSLGSKEQDPPLQVFAPSHSPVALSELSVHQLGVVRHTSTYHKIITWAASHDLQGVIRSYPGAFLAASIYICEGASEVGFLRGIDQYLVANHLHYTSIFASGSFLVDIGGASKIYSRVDAFITLGYRISVLRDDDVQPDHALEQAFIAQGGNVGLEAGLKSRLRSSFANPLDAGAVLECSARGPS